MIPGMSFTAVWAIFLPPVKQSIYFHKRKKTNDDTSMAQSTATIYSPEKYIEPPRISTETLSVEQVYESHNIEL